MKKTFTTFLSIIVLVSCSPEPKNIAPQTYFTTTQQTKLKLDVVRYIEDLAKYANNDNKFDTVFDKEYLQKAAKLDIMFLFKSNTNDTVYFAISKIAPSLKVKKVAIGGKLVYDKNNKISFYQENFRTWKMEIPELKTITEMLFQKFILNDDLTPFYTKNSKGKFIIEFPDDNNTFDTKSRSWKFSGDKSILQ